jgi:hypothetical protein
MKRGRQGVNFGRQDAQSLADFVAMGYWRAGDTELLDEINPLLGDLRNTNWRAIVRVMKRRLGAAIMGHSISMKQ